MKHQKIRGHNRRQKDIEQWRSENLDVRLNLIEESNYDYTKVIIHPWCDISIIKSDFPEPKGKTKQQMLNGLIDIYHSWKVQLDTIGQPYYLKIWLFEPRFSKSQVVCGIKDRIDRYDNLFFKPDEEKQLTTSNYGYLKEKLDKLTWDNYLDEDHFEDDYVGEPEQYRTYSDFTANKKWFTKTMKKSHRTTVFDDNREYYSFKKGDIWIGG